MELSPKSKAGDLTEVHIVQVGLRVSKTYILSEVSIMRFL